MKTVDLGQPIHCPVCKHDMHLATSVDNKREHPADGDIGLCVNCCAVLVYVTDDDKVELIPASKERLEQMKLEDPFTLYRLGIAIKQLKLLKLLEGDDGERKN